MLILCPLNWFYRIRISNPNPFMILESFSISVHMHTYLIHLLVQPPMTLHHPYEWERVSSGRLNWPTSRRFALDLVILPSTPMPNDPRAPLLLPLWCDYYIGALSHSYTRTSRKYVEVAVGANHGTNYFCISTCLSQYWFLCFIGTDEGKKSENVRGVQLNI